MPINNLGELNNIAFSCQNIANYQVNKAKQLLTDIFKTLKHNPKNVYSIGPSWASMYLTQQGLDVDHSPISGKKYDTVLAFDEAFTHYKEESSQKANIMFNAGLVEPNGVMIASLRDYRNNNFHRRPLGDTAINNIDGENLITLEVNSLDDNDKQSWHQFMYVIQNGTDFINLDCGHRRTLYFKQLAKYCSDAGSKEFGVFKEMFWKGTWRRVPEHIAWSRF